MTDQIREALFSTLGGRVVGARFLDLYAGSGSVGIEALSRGAADSTFVEADPEAVQVIRSNLDATKLAGRAIVVESEVEEYLEASPASPFDLVLIDPPFDSRLPIEMLEALARIGFLADEGLAVLRVTSRTKELDSPLPFSHSWTRRYGDSTLIYMSEKEAPP